MTYSLPLTVTPQSSSSGSGNGAPFFHGDGGICASPVLATTKDAAITVRISLPLVRVFNISFSFQR
jgi:hypothetical protein